MNGPNTNNFHAVVKQVNKFDGKRTEDFLEWQVKLRTALSLYNRATLNVLQGVQRPSSENIDGATDRATWDVANHNIFCVLFLTTSGSEFSVVRRFEKKRLRDVPGHCQQAWVALCEKFDGCSREALRAEHYRMNHTKMAPGQDPDEFLYIVDSCRDRLNRSTPPEGPTDRQYEDILLQALSPDYESIQRAHLERRDFGLADIRRMMAVIYADKLFRGSIASAGIEGPGAAMKAVDRDPSDVQCHNCSMFGHYRRYVPTAANSSIRADSTSNNPTNDSAGAVDSKRKMEAAEEIFGVHITKPSPIVTPTAALSTNKTTTMPTKPQFNHRVLVRVALLSFRNRTTTLGVPILLFRQPK